MAWFHAALSRVAQYTGNTGSNAWSNAVRSQARQCLDSEGAGTRLTQQRWEGTVKPLLPLPSTCLDHPAGKAATPLPPYVFDREGRWDLKQFDQEDADVIRYPATQSWEHAHLKVGDLGYSRESGGVGFDENATPVVGVCLDLKSEEAQQIWDLVCTQSFRDKRKNVFNGRLKRILRLQNPQLWAHYYRQKQEMQKKQAGTEVKERRLYHGTAPANIDSICEHGFLADRPAVNGKCFGKGIYFTTDSWYADVYAAEGTTGEGPRIFAGPLGTQTTPKPSNPDSTRRRPWKDDSQEEDVLAAPALLYATSPSAAESRGQNTRYYMFLSTVLTGRSKEVIPDGGQAAAQISHSHDSSHYDAVYYEEYTVYSNGQAYPEYVIEYVQKYT